jgi:hypothetical protein
MTKEQALLQLRDILARELGNQIANERSRRQFVYEAAPALLGRIEFAGSDREFWFDLLTKADLQNSVSSITTFVISQYPAISEIVLNAGLLYTSSKNVTSEMLLTNTSPNPSQEQELIKRRFDPSALFDKWNAENEPLLIEIFELPNEFELISGNRSVVVFGYSGSGKTTICRKLISITEANDDLEKPLMVEWNPRPPTEAIPTSTELVDIQLRSIFGACAFSILQYIAVKPNVFRQALSYAQEGLVWFIKAYLQLDLVHQVNALQKETNEDGRNLLQDLIDWNPRTVFEKDVFPEQVIRLLLIFLPEIKLKGVHVIADDKGIWSEVDPQKLSEVLIAFFAALALFEQQGFIYKIFLPMTLKAHLERASAIRRGRVDVCELRWTVTQLETIILNRLSLALGVKIVSLAHVCEDDTLSTWLACCAGYTPGAWIQHARLLVVTYLERYRRGQTTPINQAEWLTLRCQYPPTFIIDQETRRVTIGMTTTRPINKREFDVLNYLYAKAGQLCSYEKLYYFALLGLDDEPHAKSDEWQPIDEVREKVSEIVLRLRRLIEPDPSNPFFIVNVEEKGYCLENTSISS